jgi:hypothetical protein
MKESLVVFVNRTRRSEIKDMKTLIYALSLLTLPSLAVTVPVPEHCTQECRGDNNPSTSGQVEKVCLAHMNDDASVRTILVYRKGITGPSSWAITRSSSLRPWALALDLRYQGSFANDVFVPVQQSAHPGNETVFWTWRNPSENEFDLYGQQSDPVANQDIPYFHCKFKTQ